MKSCIVEGEEQTGEPEAAYSVNESITYICIPWNVNTIAAPTRKRPLEYTYERWTARSDVARGTYDAWHYPVDVFLSAPSCDEEPNRQEDSPWHSASYGMISLKCPL